MSVWHRLRAAWQTWRADADSDLRHPTAWLESWALGGRYVHSGMAVSPSTSMALAAYYACMRAIAEDVGKLPLQVLEHLDRGRRQAREQRLWGILHDQFNDDMSAMTGREVMTHHVLGWGNAYGLILRDRSMTRTDGEVSGIYPSPPLPRDDGEGEGDGPHRLPCPEWRGLPRDLRGA